MIFPFCIFSSLISISENNYVGKYVFIWYNCLRKNFFHLLMLSEQAEENFHQRRQAVWEGGILLPIKKIKIFVGKQGLCPIMVS